MTNEVVFKADGTNGLYISYVCWWDREAADPPGYPRKSRLFQEEGTARQQVLDKITPADNPCRSLSLSLSLVRGHSLSTQMAIFRAAFFRGDWFFPRNNGKNLVPATARLMSFYCT
ncbi:hypothetical protein PUN28_010613 [Cardiocondyla obscurior]|uniref:Uncharacterized protein n=1 Tax=Cardiocondyla obscurior TaxID=286306 RepID=A0AAW2FJ84_9HYME